MSNIKEQKTINETQSSEQNINTNEFKVDNPESEISLEIEKTASDYETKFMLQILGQSIHKKGFRPGKIPPLFVEYYKSDDLKNWFTQIHYYEIQNEYKEKGYQITEFILQSTKRDNKGLIIFSYNIKYKYDKTLKTENNEEQKHEITEDEITKNEITEDEMITEASFQNQENTKNNENVLSQTSSKNETKTEI